MLEEEIDSIDVTSRYLREDITNLRKELIHAKEDVKRITKGCRSVAQFIEMVEDNYAVVQLGESSSVYSAVLRYWLSMILIYSTLNKDLMKSGCSVCVHPRSSAVVDILPPQADNDIKVMTEKPSVTYQDIGGLDVQKQELREAVELPLLHPEIFSQIGIDPPRGVLMYGPPGTGKTMLAKAVANATTANFIQVVASEFVQKWLGDGPRMVRDIFSKARENAPCIIFIDEIDAVALKRNDSSRGGDREVQRILMELLTQMDGFDQTTNVKVIMATNRPEMLDPALMRPGRLDRKVEFPLPDRRQKRLVFQACTSKMNLSDEVDLESFVNRPQKISCADIASICQEAGLQAIRHNRYVILTKDLEKAYKKVVKRVDSEYEFYS
ncbi:26S proteasome regulatory subunit YAVVQLGESSSVYSAVLRYWLSMILIYSTLNKDLMKSGCSVCVHPR [Blastocystis sp. subtype 4]|uniref:26S proteasome regulatory subunit YAVVQLGESSSVYSAVLRYWLSMILIYSTLNKDLMKSGCSVCVHPR n=1 Tax=Blastocystis sp. subtype 4 TaxID=944170 RepID=UPI0007120929|nr:26S proteasome regulatory subunit YAVVQLGESSSVYSAVLRYWLSMILIYSTLNKDLMKSGCSVCVHPR [Blastocystis sp. subtype 4]KNB45720.1 26S proteasome regulatory subunit YAVVQLGESSSVYSAVLRYWLSMILIYSTLNKDLMKSGCSVCVHPR [Blastocystis sp. subtype 4]|eukprot:XP_014529163.1 26S proteasome regulatory subunit YAVVQLGESSSVYSAVLRYWLSMILIYSTLNKDLMKSGCSVCVHPR [Blastocystis sp. subtype 4]